MRLNGTPWRAARAVAAVVVAVVVYLVLIPQTRADHKEVGSLVLTRTAVPGVPPKAKINESVDPKQSTFAITRQAAKRDPNHTALYAREWYVTSDAPPEVGVVLQLLPDVSTARSSEKKVAAQLDSGPQLPGLKPGKAEFFSIPGVPGGRGAAFAMNDSNVPAKGTVVYAYKTVFRFDKTIMTELSAVDSSTRSTHAAVADAQAGYRLLAQREPGFSFVHDRYPLVATIVFAVVALVLVAAAVVVPELAVVAVRVRRQRRQARADARARQQYLARGRRTVRGHGAPPWSQPKRR